MPNRYSSGPTKCTAMQNAEISMSRPACCNTHVSGSGFSVEFFIEDCQLNLSNDNILSQDLSYQDHLNP